MPAPPEFIHTGTMSGDDRYDWLVRAQFLLDGTRDANTNVLTYEMYEVRLA